MMIDVLMLAGVREKPARRYAASAMQLQKEHPTFIEAYGRGGIVTAANGPPNP